MFELHITCTKDINKLSIDFADGSTIIQETQKSKVPHVEQTNWDSSSSQQEKREIIKPPELPELNREPKIDESLNNLNF